MQAIIGLSLNNLPSSWWRNSTEGFLSYAEGDFEIDFEGFADSKPAWNLQAFARCWMPDLQWRSYLTGWTYCEQIWTYQHSDSWNRWTRDESYRGYTWKKCWSWNIHLLVFSPPSRRINCRPGPSPCISSNWDLLDRACMSLMTSTSERMSLFLSTDCRKTGYSIMDYFASVNRLLFCRRATKPSLIMVK